MRTVATKPHSLGHSFRHDQARATMAREIGVQAVQFRLGLARSYLEAGDVLACDAVLLELESVLRRQRATRDGGDAWASSLTAAELRLLPLLTTHLSFKEIGERLFVSRNTVKTEAMSIYRKLGVSSRSEAVAEALELGLLGDSALPQPRRITLSG